MDGVQTQSKNDKWLLTNASWLHCRCLLMEDDSRILGENWNCNYLFWCKKSRETTETLAHGYSSESARQELSNEYQHDKIL